MHTIGKDRGAAFLAAGLCQILAQRVAVENVVAQHQRAAVVSDEGLTDDEGLGQTVRRGLHRIAERDAPAAAVAQQLLEAGRVLRGGDDQDVADAGQHQARQRVVDHRLVVDGQQLLGHSLRHRVQPGAGTSGKDDAFHGIWLARFGFVSARLRPRSLLRVALAILVVVLDPLAVGARLHVSKVSAGVQPSSRPILAASMA